MIAEFCNTMTSFSPCGRAAKKEFINFFFFWFVISFILFIVCFVLYLISFNVSINFSSFELSQTGEISSVPLSILVGLFSVFLIFEIWSAVIGGILTIKRLHDLNLSGLYYWLLTGTLLLLCIADGAVLSGFLAYIVLGCILFLAFADSYPFLNKYDTINNNGTRIADNNSDGKISV